MDNTYVNKSGVKREGIEKRNNNSECKKCESNVVEDKGIKGSNFEFKGI
jgi:hypothetical protein